jgi:hypothetical protein
VRKRDTHQERGVRSLLCAYPPHAYGFIWAARDQTSAVRGPSYLVNGAVMACQGDEHLPALHIPHTHCMIMASGGKAAATGRPSYPSHAARMALEVRERLAGSSIPEKDLCSSTAISRGEAMTIGRPGHSFESG